MRRPAIIALVLAVTWWDAGAQSPGTQSPGAPPPAPTATTLKKGNPERGRYIAEHVAMCIECHSERDDHGNIIDGRQFMGGRIPPGPPWARDWADRAPRNAGLPGYDDAAALRLLTEGAIGRGGAQLRPPMPRFRMTPEDAADVIAFMRSIT